MPAARVIGFRQFCVRFDPDGFWVAEAGGAIVGAACSIVRDGVWYLGSLHVVPAFQSRKIGSELMRRCLAFVKPGTTLAVLTDAANPASNGLYLRFGMLPQDATLTFDGPLSASTMPRAPLDVRTIDPSEDSAVLRELDVGSVGFSRASDQTFWLGVPGLLGVMLLREGVVEGYAYVSEDGAIGPVAVRHPEDLPAALDRCVEIAQGAGADRLHLRVFGSTRAAAAWAVRRGLRLTGVGLMLTSTPTGQFAGYVTSGADALY